MKYGNLPPEGRSHIAHLDQIINDLFDGRQRHDDGSDIEVRVDGESECALVYGKPYGRWGTERQYYTLETAQLDPDGEILEDTVVAARFTVSESDGFVNITNVNAIDDRGQKILDPTAMEVHIGKLVCQLPSALRENADYDPQFGDRYWA